MPTPIAIVSNTIDLRTGSTPRSVNVYTVPTGYILVLDSIDVATVSVTSPATPAVITVGISGGSSTAYEATHQRYTPSYWYLNPQENQTAAAGTIITATVITNSTATAETGVVTVNGYLIVASGNTPPTPTPPAANSDTAYFYTVDAGGNAVSGIIVEYAVGVAPAGSGMAFSGNINTVTSDGSGLAQITVAPGATYKFWSGLNPPVYYIIPALGPFPYQLPNFVYNS